MTNRIFNWNFLFTDRKLFKRLFIIHFFCFLLFCSITISLGQESIEKREKELESLPEDINRVDFLCDFSFEIYTSSPEKAEQYALEAIKLGEKLSYKKGIAEGYTVLGLSFYVRGDHTSAFENYQKALELYRELNEPVEVGKILNNIGASFYAQGNYQKSLDLAIEIGAKEIEMKALQNLSDQEDTLGNHAAALDYFKEYSILKDNILGIETREQLAELQTKYDTEKKEQENISLRMENELHEQTIQKQIYIGILVAACFGLVIILAIVFFKGQQKQKKVRLLLAEKTAYIDQLFESAQEAIVMADKEGRVLRVNEEFTRLFGYPLEEVKGRSVDDLLAPSKLHDEAAEVTKKVAEGENVTFEAVRQSKNGTKIHVSVLGSPIIVEDKMVAVYGIYRDITDRKKSEEALQYSIKQWQTTFDAMNDPVCILDEDHKISRCNQAMLDYLGKSKDDIIGQYCWKMIHGTEENIKDCPAQKSRQTKTREKLVLKMGKKWFDSTADPILDESGKVKEIVHIFSDITTRKQAEEALNKHTEELEIFNKAMVDRENRIIEMKEEVNNLCEKLGQKSVYPQIWRSKNHDKKSQL